MKSRSTLIVLKDFQRHFILYFGLYHFVFLSLLAAGIIFYFQTVVGEVMELAGLLSQRAVDIIQSKQSSGLLIMGFLVLSLSLMATLNALLFSRKIAGPLYAINRHLEDCAKKGELKELKIRKDDLFQELVNNFNQLASSKRK